MWIPAALHVIALAIALCVQFMSSPLAGAWLLFFLAGCAYTYHPPKHKDLVWWTSLAWLGALGVQTFLLQPIANGAATMWVLAAAPLLALSMSRKALKPCLRAALVLLTVYAVGLGVQMVLHVRFNNYEYPIEWRNGWAYAWPLIDPNNAACVLNFGLIPCFYMGLRDKRWWALFAVFAFAMVATASKAGGIAALAGCLLLLAELYWRQMLALSVVSFAIAITVFMPEDNAHDIIIPNLLEPLHERIPMWVASWPLLWVNPLQGLGLGSFAGYYAQVRTEWGTGGAFAHNDLLQLGIEMGLPCLLVLVGLIASVIATTTRGNIVAAGVLLAAFLQAMVEFQFYVPPVSILIGLALAYHRLTRWDNCNIMADRR